jgi:hypothetical protein
MAWVNGEWIGRKERAELIENLEQLIAEYEKRLDSLTPDELEELAVYVDELERLKRIHRAEVDLLYFAWEYFSEVRNPGNSGNWDGFDIERIEDAPQFHKEICAIIDNVSERERNAKVAVAAPRSHAKYELPVESQSVA